MIKIRKAEEGDVSQLEDLFLITRLDTFTWLPADTFKKGDFKQSTQGEIIFVAEGKDGKTLGFISVWNQDFPPFIHHLFVLPPYQKQGVGKLLINSLFSWLPLPYRLKCFAQNLNALSFYFKNNWKEVGHGDSHEGSYLLLELNASQN